MAPHLPDRSPRRGSRLHLLFAATLGASGVLGVACSTGSPASPATPIPPDLGPITPTGAPFAPVPASVYVAKVKNLLLGLAPTDAEVQAVVADPGALKGLIDQFMSAPEYREKMLGFFRNAFQQSQITLADLADQIPAGMTNNTQVANRLLGNLKESFARTVWELVSQGRPLADAVTTRQFMMTPPLVALYAYIDDLHVDDKGARIDRVVQANPSFSFSVEASAGPIPIAQTLDPASPNFMHWYNASVGAATLPPECQADPRVYTKTSLSLFTLVFGALPQMSATCGQVPGAAQFADSEFDQWSMVTIRTPRAGEPTTRFYDLPTVRAAKELVLRTPRVGFFSTPAFFASWQTNSSNQARVTMNQTLIVALGKAFDDTNVITPVSETSLDGEHAAPGTPCYGCHKTLDPMRQFFRQAYTLSYHDQADPAEATVQGVFAFGGVTAQGNGIGDLATMLAGHPRFAPAWVQKLCYYASSAACGEDDPEFLRIVAAFQASHFSWNVLVRELLASPLTTGASATKTSDDNGAVVPIARRDHLCVALSNRLGLPDVCGVGGTLVPTAAQRAAAGIAAVLPADGYSRGAEAPVLANDPTLFFRAGVENLCRNIADQVVDAPKSSRYSSGKADVAIKDFVEVVMALPPSNERAAAAQGILHEHFAAAQQGGASASDALKSTFVLACMSPSATGMGM